MHYFAHFKKVLQPLRKLQQFINYRVDRFGAQYIAFGLFGILNYPLSYAAWRGTLNTEIYENLYLRLIAAFLCLLLAIKDYWPKHLQRYLPSYWYFTVLYCIPFFGTYMLLKNHFATDWLMNMVLGFFLLVLIVDWIGFILLFFMGMVLACLTYYLTDSFDDYYFVDGNIKLAFYMYLFAIGLGGIFSHNKEKILQDKLKVAHAVGASIAHELRTPIRTIQNTFSGIRKNLEPLLSTYQRAKDASFDVDYIRPDRYESIQLGVQNTEDELDYAHTIIDILLMNVNQKKISEHYHLVPCSMVACIEHALKRYPFRPSQEPLVHFEKENDFQFSGNDILISHVLFNLLKNALYFIRKVENGAIYISLKNDNRFNYLYFKDTGPGVPKKTLPKLFTKFFTTSKNGTGLGLALCKRVMEGLNGDITCDSEIGKYTLFKLRFPKIEKT